MNDLTILNEQEVLGKQFRVYGTPEQPLFLAKDVAEWIEYSASNVSKMLNSVDEEEKTARKVCTTGTNYQTEAWFLTEDGLYEVLMQSRKPIAKAFKKKVKEILTTIRKHGVYAIDELLANPDMAIKAFTALKEEREKNRLLTADVERMKPKEIFADAVSASNTSILVGDLAKLLKQNGVQTGQKRLFEQLRNEGFLIKRKGADWNMPTQKSMEMGLFEIKESTHIDGNGCNITTKTPKVTGKGQQYFINRYLGNKEAS